jgi:diacylglycerol O-acyltransferase
VLTLPRKAMMQYTMVLMAPYMLSLLTGMGGRTRPMFNVTISNVPGPERALYFRGARLEAAFPVSLVTHGQALNITCQSYAGTLAFGFTGCRDTLPHMQRIATYTGEALAELELALSIGEPAPAAAVSARKTAARKQPAAPTTPKKTTAKTKKPVKEAKPIAAKAKPKATR